MIHPFQELMVLAQRYCRLIEGDCRDDPAWLAQVAEVLPRLHAALVSLGGGTDSATDLAADLDARFELYMRLRDRLGERDGYWLEFDQVGEPAAMTGSLADDLTDIYCELSQGLTLAETSPELALGGLFGGFQVHWGRHLFDAQRHLAVLAAQGRLVS